jgi:hypothetical protein
LAQPPDISHAQRPRLLVRIVRGVWHTLWRPAPPCPLCGTMVRPDDGWVTLGRHRYHAECAERVAGRLR